MAQPDGRRRAARARQWLRRGIGGEVAMSGIECERLGVLWRSQGEAFLQEQAVALQADMDRLRAAYVAGMDAPAPAPTRRHRRSMRAPAVIDLREPDATSMACSAAGHGDVAAAARCTHCR